MRALKYAPEGCAHSALCRETEKEKLKEKERERESESERPELCGSVSGSCLPLSARLTGEECGRTNSDFNADKNSLMKQFALGE